VSLSDRRQTDRVTTRHIRQIREATRELNRLMSTDRSLASDWEFWHALAVGSLLVWIWAQASRFRLMGLLQSLAWTLHGTVPYVPQASLDRVRPVVDTLVALWFPVAVVSFVCGFVVFHTHAEAGTEPEWSGDD